MKNKLFFTLLFFCICSPTLMWGAGSFQLHSDKSEKTTLTGTEVLGLEDPADAYKIKWTTPSGIKTYIVDTTEVITAAEIGGLWSGTGYMKTDGTAGDLTASTTFAGLTDLPSGVNLTTLGYLSGATSNLQTQISALSSGGISPYYVSSDPTNASPIGLYASSASGHWFWVAGANGLWDMSAGTHTANDITPDAFSFTSLTDQAADGSLKCSAAITPTGTNYPAAYTTSGDTGCSVKINGGAAATTGTWAPTQTVEACVNASSSSSATTSCTTSIGGVAATQAFSVVTAAFVGHSDDFSAADSTLITTHDANWERPGTLYNITTATIYSNHLSSTVLEATAGRYSASTSDISQVTVMAMAEGGTAKKGPMVRGSSAMLGYSANFSNVTSVTYQNIEIRKNGVYQTECAMTNSITSDHTLRISAEEVGASVVINVFVDSSATPNCTYTDTSDTIESGNPGFAIIADNVVGNSYIDDWQDY